MADDTHPLPALRFEERDGRILCSVTALDPATSKTELAELQRQVAEGRLTMSISAPASSPLGRAIARAREL